MECQARPFLQAARVLNALEGFLRAYNRSQACRWLWAQNSGLMRSLRRWVQAGWERYTARAIRDWSAL